MSVVLQWLGVFVSILAAALAVGFWAWVRRMFGVLDPAAAIFNLTIGVRVSLEGNRALPRSFRRVCIYRPAGAALAVTALLWLLADGAAQTWLRGAVAGLLAAPAVFVALPPALAAAAAVALMARPLAQRFGGEVSRADNLYVDPAAVAIRPRRPMNLVVIQMESLEASFGRADVFGRDALAPLDGLGGFGFARLQPSAGTGWTMSSMMATLFGVPFAAPLAFVRAFRAGGGALLPSATGLGDVLKRHGYANVAMQGALSTFHGFSDLFGGHGFDRVLGAEHLLARRATPESSWGVYDDDLMEHALEELEALRATGGRHCLYVVLSDTHGPHGDASPKLWRLKARPDILDVVEHSGRAVAGFVAALGERGHLADTNVAIIGDHLRPSTPALPQLDGLAGRGIYNRFIALQPPAPARDTIQQFDLPATLLDFAGFDVAGGRFGLGSSGLLPNGLDAATAARTAVAKRLASGSTVLARLWAAP